MDNNNNNNNGIKTHSKFMIMIMVRMMMIMIITDHEWISLNLKDFFFFLSDSESISQWPNQINLEWNENMNYSMIILLYMNG